MFAGNSDRYTVQINHLEPTIEAQYIKIVPDEWRNQISLRLELYGCSQGEKSRIEIFLHICIICHAGVYSVKADRSYKQKAKQLLIDRPDYFSLCSAGDPWRFIVAQVVSGSRGRRERLAS